jgi:hypothetical protein
MLGFSGRLLGHFEDRGVIGIIIIRFYAMKTNLSFACIATDF